MKEALWWKPLENGAWALMVLNRNKEPRKVAFDWKAESVTDPLSKRDAAFGKTSCGLRDLWTGKPAGTTARPLARPASTTA